MGSPSNSSPIFMVAELAWMTSMGSCRTCVKARSWKTKHRQVVFKADGGDEGLNEHPWTTHFQLSAPGCRVLHVAAVLLKLIWVPAWKWSNENWTRRLIFNEVKLVYICTRYLTCTCRPCRRSSGRAGSRRRGFSCARLYVSGALSRSEKIPPLKPGTVWTIKRYLRSGVQTTHLRRCIHLWPLCQLILHSAVHAVAIRRDLPDLQLFLGQLLSQDQTFLVPGALQVFHLCVCDPALPLFLLSSLLVLEGSSKHSRLKTWKGDQSKTKTACCSN